jgi:hypothetical protein
MSLHLGWTPDHEAVESVLNDSETPVFRMSADQSRMMQASFADPSKPPVILFDSLRALQPDWERGNQGIGDCVSWGWELGTTLSVASDIRQKLRPWIWKGPYATEPYYGGARVEARGIKQGGYRDGAVGAYAAKFATKWGALPRLDYSSTTGNQDHDLRSYSAKRSKEWGNFGCGGSFDKNALDDLCKLTPIIEAPLTTTFDQAAGIIESGFPVVVCSDQGLSDKRDKDGFVVGRGTWYHCMTFAGVRYDRPGLLCVNSWGNSWGLGDWYRSTKTGEVIDYWPAVQKCSAWVDAKTCDRMLRQEDSYAVCGVGGLQRRSIDWTKGW